jgi:hypothetical protein
MKKKKAVFWGLVLLTVLFVGCTSKPAELQQFNSTEGGFSILLPGTPKYAVETVDSAAGPLVVNTYMVDGFDKAYGVMYTDYPDAVLETDPQKVLDGARDGAVTNVKGKLLSEAAMTLNGYPGREMNISAGQLGVRSRVYLVNKRIYSVIVTGPVNQMNLSVFDEVLNSFNLTE